MFVCVCVCGGGVEEFFVVFKSLNFIDSQTKLFNIGYPYCLLIVLSINLIGLTFIMDDSLSNTSDQSSDTDDTSIASSQPSHRLASINEKRGRGRPRKQSSTTNNNNHSNKNNQPLDGKDAKKYPKIPQRFPNWLTDAIEYYPEEDKVKRTGHQWISFLQKKWPDLTIVRIREEAKSEKPSVETKAAKLAKERKALKDHLASLEQETNISDQENDHSHVNETSDSDDNHNDSSDIKSDQEVSVEEMDHDDDDDDHDHHSNPSSSHQALNEAIMSDNEDDEKNNEYGNNDDDGSSNVISNSRVIKKSNKDHHSTTFDHHDPNDTSPSSKHSTLKNSGLSNNDRDALLFRKTSNLSLKKQRQKQLQMSQLVAKLHRNQARIIELKASSDDPVEQAHLNSLIPDVLAPSQSLISSHTNLDAMSPLPSLPPLIRELTDISMLTDVLPDEEIPAHVVAFDRALACRDTTMVMSALETHALSQAQFYLSHSREEIAQHHYALPVTTHALYQLTNLLDITVPLYSQARLALPNKIHSSNTNLPDPLQSRGRKQRRISQQKNHSRRLNDNVMIEDTHRLVSRKRLRSAYDPAVVQKRWTLSRQPSLADLNENFIQDQHFSPKASSQNLPFQSTQEMPASMDTSMVKSTRSIAKSSASTSTLGIVWDEDGSVLPRQD